jgi:hypothetical protein
MKSRLFWILAIGLLLAVLLLGAVQLTSLLGRAVPTDEVVAAPVKSEADTGITPVIFRTVNEYGPAGEKMLRLNGTSEPNAVLIVLNNNERLRQIRADEEGNWAIDIDVNSDDIMVIEIVMFVEGGLNVRGDETVLRIPVPSKEAVLPDDNTEYIAPSLHMSLIMVTAPGGPSRIVQTPFGGSPTDGPLTMGPIDYDDVGGVIFSGTTEEEGRVRIFAGPQQIGETRVGAGGRWNFIAGNMLPLGEYEIAAELIKTDGIAARVSVPFERLPPSQDNSPSATPDVRYEPFRWQIRRPLLGGGAQYTAIFAPQEAEALIVEE